MLASWDGSWFLTVVHGGYPAQIPMSGGAVRESTLAFFPLYPLLIRIAAWVLPGPDAWAAIGVSLGCGAIAVLLIHRLTELVADRRTADRTVVLFCVFPGSMVLSWAYSEGLMIALAAGCLLALLQRRWFLAGALAGAATACRPTAIVLVGVCLWEAVTAARRDETWRPFVAPVLAPIGGLAFLSFLWARTGDPLAFIHAEQAWGVAPKMGAATWSIMQAAARAPLAVPAYTIAFVSVIFAAATVVLLVRRGWPVMLSLYTLGILALSLSSRSDGLRPRDLLTAFPLLIGLAATVSERNFWLLTRLFLTLLLVSMVFHGVGLWTQP
jgi:hypothetical protein